MNELLGKIVVIKRNGTDGPHFPLRTNECLFGRKPECDIRIQLPNVSQEHAVIRIDNSKKIKLINLSSCSQTLVNGKPIETIEVQHLDVFTISDRSFRFELPSPQKKVIKSTKKQRRRSSTSLQSEQENKTPKMPTPKGSPRTPPTVGSLKERIHSMRRDSVPLREEDETSSSPAPSKNPFGMKTVNLQEIVQNCVQELSEKKSGKEKVEETSRGVQRRSKRVSFGPVLSPEQFDKSLPPSTPVRRGATPKRHSLPRDSVVSEITSVLKRQSIAATPQTVPIAEEEEFIEAEEASQEYGTPKGRRRSSSRLSTKSPLFTEHGHDNVDSMAEVEDQAVRSTTHTDVDGTQATCSVNSDDEEANETAILDSENYTSDEESELEQEPSSVMMPKRLATPVREDIQKGVELRKTKKKLATPIRKEINEGVELRKTKKKLATPVRKEIHEGIELRETKKKLATPVRTQIRQGVTLKKTKNKLTTPLRKEIQQGRQLRETKKKMATPLKKDIQAGFKLRQTKMKLTTPLRKEILAGTKLRQTKKKMATPVRKQIEARPKLRQTKKTMDSALQDEIKQGVSLRKLKQSMPLELQIEIIKGKKLRQTVKRMPTPLKKAIAQGVTLRKTKKSLPTPVKEDIRRGTSLRKTKNSLPTPVKKQIEAGRKLKKSKKIMATPLKKEIHGGISLKSLKRSRSESEEKVNPAKKLKTSPTEDITDEEAGKETKEEVPMRRALKTPLRKAITSGFRLRPLRPRMGTPRRKMIHSKPTLRPVRRKYAATAMVKKAARQKPTYAEIVKRSKPSNARRSSKGASLAKARNVSPAITSISNTEKPESCALQTEERRKSIRKRTSLQEKKRPLLESPVTAENLAGIPELFTTPVADSASSKPQKRTWMSSLARVANGPRSKGMPVNDYEGLSTMFATPPPAGEVRATRSSKPKQAGNWLSSLAIATKGPHKRGVPVEDLQGVAEMFATPISAKGAPKLQFEIATPRQMSSIPCMASLSSPESMTELEKVKALNTSKTPPSRTAEKDSLKVEMVSPIQIGRTPSLRSAKKQTLLTAATPEPITNLMKADAINPSKTPSLRSSDNDAIEIETVAPLRSSRTPYLRSARKETMVATASPEAVTDLEIVDAINPCKTPSLRKVDRDAVEVEIVTTPQSSRTPSLRSAKKQTAMTVATPEAMTDLEIVDAINPCKTPSLRRVDSDAVEVETVTPLQSSRTPSLRSAKKQTVITAATPEPITNLEKVDVINPCKTPSLRKADNDSIEVETVTPLQSSCTPSLRSAKKQTVMIAATPEQMTDLEIMDTINPCKTPSLREAGSDAVEAETVTALKSSHTPSLRSAKKQTELTAATPGPMTDPEVVDTINLSKTPSLREAGSDTVEVETVTPLQSSRTPSLRSAKKQTVVTTASPGTMNQELVVVNTLIQPSHTPSLRSAKKQSTVLISTTPQSEAELVQSAKPRKSLTKSSPTTQDGVACRLATRKSLGLTGVARLMKSPKETNAVENPEDLFVPRMFAEAKPERKSVDLLGIATLVQTPRAESKESVASPNFTGLRKLLKTPKVSRQGCYPEENFVPDLFTSPDLERELSTDADVTLLAVKEVKRGRKAGRETEKTSPEEPTATTTRRSASAVSGEEVPNSPLTVSSPEVPTRRTTRRTRVTDPVVAPKAIRTKRGKPEDSTEPPPKRARKTRASKNQKTEVVDSQHQDAKVQQVNKGDGGEKNLSAAAIETPKPAVFQRTQLEPIIEIVSPVPRFDICPESPAKATVEKKASIPKGTKTTASKVIRKDAPPQRNTRSKTRTNPETELSQEEPVKRRNTRASKMKGSADYQIDHITETSTGGKVAAETREGSAKMNTEVHVPAVPRTTRSKKIEEALAVEAHEDKPKGSKTRATRSQSAVEETSTNAPAQPGKKTVVKDASSVSEASKRTHNKRRETTTGAESRETKDNLEEKALKACNVRGKRASNEGEQETTEIKATRSLRSQPKASDVPDEPATARRTRRNTVRESKEQAVEAFSARDTSSGRGQAEDSEQERVRSTRSTRNAEPVIPKEDPPPKTRGAKRTLQDSSDSAIPEPKRTRSSTRSQAAATNVRQTRSRARK